MTDIPPDNAGGNGNTRSGGRKQETRAQRRRRRKQEQDAEASAAVDRAPMDPALQARMLALGISISFARALQASTVTVITTHAFRRSRELFRTHPANTLAHGALQALEQRCTVDVYEWLSAAGKTFGIGEEMRAEWQELRNHRDHASHTAEINWYRPEMIEFAKAGRYVGIKAAEIWSATRRIRAQLSDEDAHLLPDEVPMDYSMATLVDGIYRASMTPNAIAALPPVPLMFEQLKVAAKDYVRQLRERADKTRRR